MGVNLSVSSMIAIIISVFLIIAGIFLLINISNIRENIIFPIPKGEVFVEVNPISSQKGTLFFISALYPGIRENQDLMLFIEGKDYSSSLYLYDDGEHYDKKKGDGVYGGFFDSKKVESGKYGIKDENKELASFFVSEDKCEIVYGDGNENNINFVIVPSGYKDYNEFKRDSLKLIADKNSFLNIEPYNSKKDKISFSLVNISELNCEIGCKDIPTIVCCDNNFVFESASKCHYDNVIVLLDSNKYCGSASSYAKICAKNSNANLILLHETGHSFADLADEYVYEEEYGSYDIGEINSPNCDAFRCEKWKNLTEECYEGCSYSNLYRPSKTSIMYELVPFFNLVSQKHIENLIDNYVFGEKNMEKAVPGRKSYIVNFNYDKGNLKIEDVFLKPIKSNIGFKKSDYSMIIEDENGNEIFKTSLYLPDKIFPVPNSSAKILKEESFEFSALLPYSQNADNLVVYKKDRPVVQASLAVFSANCGNKICEETENHLKCPSDCIVDDNFCETSACDPDCASQKNCEKKQEIKYWIAIILIGIALIVVLLIIIFGIGKTKK